MNAVMSQQNRHPIRWETWALAQEADRRFLKIVAIVAVVMIAIAFGISLIKAGGRQHEAGTYNGNRYVELLPEQPSAEAAPKAEEPKPAKEDSKTAPQESAPKAPVKPAEKPVQQPVPDKTQTARDVANKSGILALKDQLSDLRDPNLNALDNSQPLISGTLNSKGGTQASASGSPDSVAASAASGSGGIGGNGSASVTTTQSGTGVGTRRTSTVQSPLGFGRSASQEGDSGGKGLSGNRGSNELKLVFDRNSAAFYAIFGHASRENPDLGAGTILVNLTIAPDGAVTQCHLVSSPFHDADLERKIVERVKLLNFGAKNVPPYTTDWPIIYLPS